MAYQQQAFITADQSAFQRAGSTGPAGGGAAAGTAPGQYALTGQPSPLAPVAGQTATSPASAQQQRAQMNGQFIDPASTTAQPVPYERQEYVNGYQQQVSCRTINLSDF